MTKVKAILLTVSALALVACGETVEPGNVGVKIYTFGSKAGVDPEPRMPGWVANGWGESVVEFPTIQRTYTYTREPDERGVENEEIGFADNTGLPMTADVQLVLRIDPSCAPALYQKYRLDFDQLFDGPIRNDVRTAISAESELVNVERMYSGGRQEVIQKAMGRVVKKWAGDCVAISQLDWIGNIRYPEIILTAIQNKTKVEQETLAAEAQVARATANANAKIEEARGIAESNRLLAESVAKDPEVLQLKAIEAWDGKLPVYMGGDTPLPFLDVAQ